MTSPGQITYGSLLPGWLLLLAMAGIAAAVFARRVYQLYRYMRLGAPDDRFADNGERIRRFLEFVIGQGRLFRDPRAGAMHAAIFWGFIVITVGTIELLGRGFFGRFAIPLVSGQPWFLLALDIFEAAVVLAIVYAFYRRLVSRPRRLYFSGEALVILGLIVGLMVTSFLAGGFRLAHDPALSSQWAPVTDWLGRNLRHAGVGSATALRWYQVFWWGHVAILFTFLAFIPYSKHLHIATAPFNVYFSSTRPRGQLAAIDFETTENLGASKVEDLSWKHLLDTYTCTECGRCDAVCPATSTGKELKPRSIILNLQHYLIDEAGPRLLADQPQRSGTPRWMPSLPGRSGTQVEQDTALRPLLGDVISEQALWECTTCRACMQECPVFIEHVPKIVDMRRALVMMESRFPPELNDVFRGLEMAGNPWQYSNETRALWSAELEVPIFEDRIPDDVEYLFWVGCYGSFDNRNKKVSMALGRILQRAGVSFGILGPREKCCGDPARRAGNEYLYQMLAEENVATLNEVDARKIVTACAHCFNNLKNELPQRGGRYEVVHHSELIAQLVAEGRLRLDQPIDRTVTYHDPCYLGRYNGVFDPPRFVLERIEKLELREMARSRDRSFCCGAGGARGFMEEPAGHRVNEARVAQAEETGATTLAVSCPFCMNMFQDGIQGRGAGDRLVGEDIAELAEQASRPRAASGEE
ncbi:MAG TPA: (Fe-S)-binding protein [Chloroflexota bacterium]|nr:(Fe-S)-binding protein [Chloroflexota bacterium]